MITDLKVLWSDGGAGDYRALVEPGSPAEAKLVKKGFGTRPKSGRPKKRKPKNKMFVPLS